MASSTELELARKIATEKLNLQVRDIGPIGKGYNNFIFKLSLDDCHDFRSDRGRPQPGTVALPPQTRELILRIPNPDASLNNPARVEHEVAVLALLRSSESQKLKALIPDVYSWKNYVDSNDTGWILSQHMQGTNVGLEFPRIPLERQKIIVHQLAQIAKAIQDLSIPSSVRGYGGACFNDAGEVVSGPAALPIGAPYETYQDLYKGLLRRQLELSDSSDVLNGWRDSGLRDRLDKFLAEGIDAIFKTTAVSSRKCLVHGDLSTHNILVDPDTFEITALLDFELSHIASPLEEYLYSFYDVHGLLPGLYTTDEGMVAVRKALLDGFPSPLPESPPLPTGPVRFGEKQNIQWELLKAWDDELAALGVLRPATIPYAADISALHWFSQDVCQFYFLQDMWLEAIGEKRVAEERKEQQELLEQYLTGRGY
ncbi:hypothetical protein FE257_012790 [Aspergillus nanangensis]|uniref:non-specific serine/threonine protein kinase n=1 Tax=Aspergillus nanangensis TaxID=2582783 RepID=A0AAD4GPT1_ASPNN|nr:hypothetical protein FE257_012790 [Aspergillus nanangensis]